MESGVKWSISRIILDLLSLILVLLPTVIWSFGLVTPYQRGFFCNDLSIHYPYREDTVSVLACELLAFVMPIALIILTEMVRIINAKSIKELSEQYHAGFVRHYVVCLYKIVGTFLFGYFVCHSITDIGKATIGRLRPHFIDVCRPDASRYNCTGSNDLYVYVEDVVCTGTNKLQLLNSRLSFPSGHSSSAAYSAVFLLVYLQARFTWSGSTLLKHLAQAVIIYGAIFISLSRVSDHKHHWSDVLGGSIIGSFVAALTSVHIFNMFGMSSQLNEDQPGDRTSPDFFTSIFARSNSRLLNCASDYEPI